MLKGLKNSHIIILAIIAAIFIYFSMSKKREKYEPIFKTPLIKKNLFESFEDISDDQRTLIKAKVGEMEKAALMSGASPQEIQTINSQIRDIEKQYGILESFEVTPDGRCGPKHNNTHCAGTQCCSKDGFCGGEIGVKSEWCSSKKLNSRYSGWYSKYDGDGSK